MGLVLEILATAILAVWVLFRLRAMVRLIRARQAAEASRPRSERPVAKAEPTDRRRTVLKWVLGIGCATVLVPVALLVVVFWPFITADHSPFDVGPLHGRAASPPTSAPTSSVRMGTFTVDCYSPHGKVVVLVSRRADGSVVGAWQMRHRRWKDSADECECKTCVVARSQRKKDGYVVHGWTEPKHEHVTLYFDKSGRLTEYYVSW